MRRTHQDKRRIKTAGLTALMMTVVAYLLTATSFALAHSLSAGLVITVLCIAAFLLALAHWIKPAHIHFALPLVALTYLAWCLLAQPENSEHGRGDFSIYFLQAKQLATSGFRRLDLILEAKAPTVLWFYAGAMALFGTSYVAVYIANAVVWTAQVFFLYKILDQIPQTQNSAVLGALLYGLHPAVISYTGLPTSEGLFIALMLGGLLLCLREAQRHTPGRAVVFGAVLGAAYLTRFSGLLVGFSFIGYLLAEWHHRDRPFAEIAQRTAWVAIGIAVVLAPLAIFNGLHGAGFSPSSYRGHRVLIVRGLVTFNDIDRHHEDFAKAASELEAARIEFVESKERPRATDLSKFSEALRGAEALLLGRVRAAPFQYAKFALTTKLAVMWSRDGTTLSRSLRDSPHARSIALYRKQILLGIESCYVLLLAMATGTLATLFVRRRKLDAELRRKLTFLLLLPILLMAAPHLLIEVKPRFHAPFIPYLAALAAIGWTHCDQRLLSRE